MYLFTRDMSICIYNLYIECCRLDINVLYIYIYGYNILENNRK